MSTRVKHGLAACFGAGVITFLLAVSLFPAWGYIGAFLAALAGAFVGYVGADILEFIRAIPGSFRKAVVSVGGNFQKVTSFFKKSRPLMIVQAVVSAGIYFCLYHWILITGYCSAVILSPLLSFIM